MSERKPARDGYDAALTLFPPESPSEAAVSYVKRTYALSQGRMQLCEPVPLAGIDEELAYASDFAFERPGTDLIVDGDAVAPDGKAVKSMHVSVRCGAQRKDALVLGDRVAELSQGRVVFSDPEPFETMDIGWENAYGGADFTVDAPDEINSMIALGIAADHPGMYPRNPLGKGYVVGPLLDEPLPLPNIEDPSNLLRPERLFAGDPRAWASMPLPWGFQWTSLDMFPRCLFMGMEPWHPVPVDAALIEARRGFFDPRWLDDDGPQGAFRMFSQDAAHGLVIARAAPGTPIEIDGMSALEPTLRLTIPEAPTMTLIVESERIALAPKLASIVVQPNEGKVSFTWSSAHATRRKYIPGIFREIPLALVIDGDAPLRYDTPASLLDRAKATRSR